MRSAVCKAYSLWASSLLKITPTKKGMRSKAEDAVVYTLPAKVWELEQMVAMETRLTQSLGLENMVSLHTFESDPETYRNEQNTRAFMLNTALYPNFRFQYDNKCIHANRHAKANFFGWFDFCGLPTYDKLEVVLDHKNFVHNSVVFVTFSCAWRRSENVPSEIRDAAYDKIADDEDKLCNHVTDAVEEYLDAHTGNGVKVFMSVEYLAQNTPMMMIGLSNCQKILDHSRKMPHPIRTRIDPTARNSQTSRADGTPRCKPLGSSALNDLREDLKTWSFTRAELATKYNCTERQVGAAGAWLTQWGEDWGVLTA